MRTSSKKQILLVMLLLLSLSLISAAEEVKFSGSVGDIFEGTISSENKNSWCNMTIEYSPKDFGTNTISFSQNPITILSASENETEYTLQANECGDYTLNIYSKAGFRRKGIYILYSE